MFWPAPALNQNQNPIETVKIKHLVLSFLVLAAAALTAEAQPQTLLSSYTIPAAGATNFPNGLTIDCRGQQNVLLQVSSDGGGTNISTLLFQAYLDVGTNVASADGLGVNAGSGSFHVHVPVSVTAAQTRIVCHTNLAVAGIPSLRLTWATNAGVAMTNVTVKYWVKKNAP